MFYKIWHLVFCPMGWHLWEPSPLQDTGFPRERCRVCLAPRP